MTISVDAAKTKAFTLVELLIVILIIGVLAAVIAPKFVEMQRKAKEAATKRNLAAIRAAIKFYQAEHEGRLPYYDATAADGEITLHEDTTPSSSDNELVPNYISELPPVYLGQEANWTLDYEGNPHEGDNDFKITGPLHWANIPRRSCSGGGSNVEYLYNWETGEVWINASNAWNDEFLTDSNGEEIRWW